MIHGWFDEQGRPYVFAAVATAEGGLYPVGQANWWIPEPMLRHCIPGTAADCRMAFLSNVGETTGIGGVSEYFREAALVTFKDIEDSCSQVYAVAHRHRLVRLCTMAASLRSLGRTF